MTGYPSVCIAFRKKNDENELHLNVPSKNSVRIVLLILTFGFVAAETNNSGKMVKHD